MCETVSSCLVLSMIYIRDCFGGLCESLISSVDNLNSTEYNKLLEHEDSNTDDSDDSDTFPPNFDDNSNDDDEPVGYTKE